MLLRKLPSDSSWGVYFLRQASFIWTWVNTVIFSFNKEERLNFYTNKNIFYRLSQKTAKIYDEIDNNEFNKKFLKNDMYDFNGIYLPKINDVRVLRLVYEDVLSIYTEKNDNYSYKFFDEVEKNSTEGPFCYVSPTGEDITVHKNDVVIDAGAWIGDFSAYCAKKKAFVYAFEPSLSNIKLLEKTIEYNKAEKYIKIAPYGLCDKEGLVNFNDAEQVSSNNIDINGNIQIKVATLDNWAKENNIKKIDFIKADIEGQERNMLLGAKEVLKKFQPTLSICTYHLIDDPEVLEKIILESNPNYKIIHKRMKLFAYVNKK